MDFLDSALAKEIPNAAAVSRWRDIAAGLRNGTVNSWAWRMQLSMLRAKRRFVTPAVNLATNIGFGEDSTHTAQKPAWLQGWGTGSYTPPSGGADALKADENFDQFENQVILGVPVTKSLDLGCGRNPKNLFNADMLYGIDIRDDLERRIKKADLVVEPIPFEDEYFDYVTAHDFIEHVPRLLYCPERRYPFVELMNEIYRVLKPNGRFLSFTPAYPHSEAFRDPTHVNIITDQTYVAYFDEVNRWGQMYGFNGAFRILSQEWRGPHLLSILQKVPTPLGNVAT
jgi:SAM-dependent methyltransferase